MKILPGHVSDPDWSGPRCARCARPIGGDGSMMFDCQDANQTCMTFERIPPARRDAFCIARVWSNALQVKGNVLDAIEWMSAGKKGKTPLALLRDGRGLEVLEAQLVEFPMLVQRAEAAERAQNALRRAANA